MSPNQNVIEVTIPVGVAHEAVTKGWLPDWD